MKRIYLIFLISVIVSSCNNKETTTIDDASESFPVLSYDAEIFETLSLDKSEITIKDTKEVLYWSKNFQNGPWRVQKGVRWVKWVELS